MKIIIAVDGSECSDKAVNECCRFFRKESDLEIRVVSVYENVSLLLGRESTLPEDYCHQIELEEKAETQKIALKAAGTIRSECLGAIISTEILEGKAAPQIIEAATEWKSDLIIVGSHGYGFWSRLVVGSVSDALIHHAPCSVMVIRDDYAREKVEVMSKDLIGHAIQQMV